MLRAGLMFCIANDPVPTVLDVFHKMFPCVETPRIIYGDLPKGIKGIYDRDKHLIVISPRIPIGRVPDILAHELVHCALGMPDHGPGFWQMHKKLCAASLKSWKKKQRKDSRYKKDSGRRTYKAIGDKR